MTSQTKSDKPVVGRLHTWAARLLCSLGVFAFAITSASAQENSIESVTASESGSNVVVRIEMKATPKNPPASFAVANPARVALDFPATANNTGKNVIDVSQGDLRSVNVVTVGDRSRLVLNLKRSVSYTTTIEGSTVVVTLDGGSASAAAASAGTAAATTDAAPVRFAEPAGAGHSVRGIDFRRGRNGEGRVVVDLSDTQTGVDIRQQGQTIVVEFLKSALPNNLRRKLDVTDFGTPVQSVTTSTVGDNVRMVIEPRGLWEHNAYQSDTQFVVEVRPVKEDPNKLIQGSQQGYKGEKLSLNFQNIEVRAVLQVIADFTNLNIITSETVSGNLTLRLRDVPWDQALDIVLQAKGLDMRKNGNVIWVAPREELAAKEKLDLEAKQSIAELEPLRTESYQLNYQKAADVMKLISDDKQRMLSKRGSAVPDTRTNQLFVQDIASKLEDIRRLIRQIDIPTRQVLIEARIVEATDGFSRNLGVRLSGTSGVPREVGGSGVYGSITGGNVAVNNESTSDTTTTTVTAGDFTLSSSDFVNMPAASLNGFSSGALGITLFNASLSRFISLELSALESDGKGRIISSPRVITADQVRATIEDGEEIPYEQSTSSGATSIEIRSRTKTKPRIVPTAIAAINR